MRRFAVTITGLSICALVAVGCGSTRSEAGATAGDQQLKSQKAASAVSPDLGLGHPSPKLCNGKHYTIGFDTFSDTQDYAVQVQKSLASTSKHLGCVKLITLSDNADPSTAVSNVKTLIQRKVDGVVLMQIVASAQPGIVKMLKKAGIPAVAHSVPAPGIPFVSPSDFEAGKAAGKALADAAKQKDAGQSPWLVLGTNPATAAVSDARIGGIKNAVKAAFPNMPANQIIELDTQSKPDIAFNRASSIVTKVKQGSPVLIGGLNDDVVGGIFRAFSQAGRKADTLAVGIGALYPGGVTNVCRNPQFVGTVDFEPDSIGNYVMPILLNEIAGKKVPESVKTPERLLDKAAVEKKYPSLDCG